MSKDRVKKPRQSKKTPKIDQKPDVKIQSDPAPVEPKKMGRPSKYDPSYCEQLISHMKQGLSFESFAAVIGVNQDTLFEWVKVHKDFSEAKKEAFGHSMLFYEKMGIIGMTGAKKGFNVTAWIFNMKNRFKWRDNVHVTNEDDDPIKKTLEDALAALDADQKP